jgi:membrane protein DedA with SNARE-associated domain
MLESLTNSIVNLISNLGYTGIFIGMLIESSFIPFPSEIIMIPAGYLIWKGEMNAWSVILTGTLGALSGAFINYYLAKTLGRQVLTKFGSYFFISENSFLKAENFFHKHGSFSTLVGRLLPGIRQLISIPAGLFNMNIVSFTILTTIGSICWISILVIIGFFLGQNKEAITTYLPLIKLSVILICVILIGGYIIYNYKFKKRQKRVSEK